MKSRRDCLSLVLTAAVSAPLAHAGIAYEVYKVGPKPKLIKGKPDKVDFGHGLLIPMSRDAFQCLWEGDDRWITYGHGFGGSEGAAMGQAEDAAVATMKFYLLTLAFAPDRLERVDGGGWRLKSGNAQDLVRGDITLPGRPVMPTVDHMNSYMQGETGDEGRSVEASHATTGWLVWKKDVILTSVRKNARVYSLCFEDDPECKKP